MRAPELLASPTVRHGMRAAIRLALCAAALLAAHDAYADDAIERAEAHALLERLGMHTPSIGPEHLRALEADHVDQTTLTRWIEATFHDCLARSSSCTRPGLSTLAPHDATPEILLAALGEVATEAVTPLLFRLIARDVLDASIVLQRIRLRALQASPGRCVPPSANEVAAARRGLQDFAIVRAHDGRLRAEVPSHAELDDLAYFQAAVDRVGDEVGGTSTDGTCHRKPTPAATHDRDRAAATLARARMAGDLVGMVAAGRAYLTTFGFPRPMCVTSNTEFAWGGARFSYVMREVASALEGLGRFAEAHALWRRANPGGGACGTSYWYIWQQQVEGVIRTAERSGDCRRALAERLLSVRGDDDTYGSARLRRAGFDVVRLYRGARVTENRDVDASEIERILAVAPLPQSPLYVARFHTRGAEDWDRRVHALDGLAALEGRTALPTLLRSARDGSVPTQERALAAIEVLARRSEYDPCDPTLGFGGSFSSTWSRPIRALSERCSTVLRRAAMNGVAQQLRPLLDDSSGEIRAAAVRTLGSIGAPSSVPWLSALRERDDYQSGERCEMTAQGSLGACAPVWPVREAAGEALERIAGLETPHTEP